MPSGPTPTRLVSFISVLVAQLELVALHHRVETAFADQSS